jgi:hypothetical protein
MPAGDVPTGTSPTGTSPTGIVPSETLPPTAPAGAAPSQDPTAPPCVPAAPQTQPCPTSAEPADAQPTTPVPPVAPEGRTAAPQGAGPDHASDRAAQTDAPPGQISVPEQRGAELLGARLPRPDAAEDLASKRVRVVLAERKGVARPVRTVVDIQEGTGVGELLRTNLIGSQLAVALRFAIGAGLTLGLLPLLFAMFPEIGRVEVLGIRLPWLLLGVLVYPFLFGLGLWHTRTAEHVEQNFADHVQD